VHGEDAGRRVDAGIDESASLPRKLRLLRSRVNRVERLSRCRATTTRPKITATAESKGVVSHVGSRLLADVADRTTLTAELTEVLAGLRKPRTRQDPGRVLVDMAVADGATTVSDIAVLADQAELFGSVASDSTCRRLLDRLHGTQLAAIASARAAAREVVWAQRAESTGEAFAAARAAGRVLPGLVVDLDASIVICHNEKEQAAPTFKHTFGFHPMLAFCDNTGSTPRSPRSPTNITMAPRSSSAPTPPAAPASSSPTSVHCAPRP
jgi:hypothetical protein